MTVARVRPPSEYRVVFDGQSLNYFPFAIGGMGVLLNNLFAEEDIILPCVNVAVAGQGWYELEDDADTRLYPQARDRTGDILIMNGGQSDILEVERSGADIYSDITDYITNARAAGFDHIIITNLPAFGPDTSGGFTVTPTMETAASDLRALILANSAGADEVVDLFVSPLNDATNTTYWLADRLHPTTTGAEYMVNLIKTAVESIIQ